MALVPMRLLLDHAAENGYGIPAFNVNNLEQILAIMQAADETDSPVILQASRGARKYAGENFLRHLILGAVGATFYVIGVGLLYGVTGTLNMNDLAQKLPSLHNHLQEMHEILLLFHAPAAIPHLPSTMPFWDTPYQHKGSQHHFRSIDGPLKVRCLHNQKALCAP